MHFEQVFYEPDALGYALGTKLREQFRDLPWTPVESHNSIEALQKRPNSDFPHMKRFLVVGVRKTLGHVKNNKLSDFLVPYTSSGCSAMCLYCYLVCNYNKCSYLRLFVNREAMLDKMLRQAGRLEGDPVFEIGSNSDLVLENTVTGNLEWTIRAFGNAGKGRITFPTKFDSVEPLLGLPHNGRVIVRMSVNPEEIIRKIELGTSPLGARIRAVNRLCDAGYRVGILIAPVVLTDNWRVQYGELIDRLADELTPRAKSGLFFEIIFMTYSYVHRAINREAFPNAAELYDPALMTGRGRGRYCYNAAARGEGELLLRQKLDEKFHTIPILYVV